MRTKACTVRGLALVLLLLAVSACSPNSEQRVLAAPALDASLLARLADSGPFDPLLVVTELQLEADSGRSGFLTADPFRPATPLNEVECAELPACRYGREVLGWREPVFPGRQTVLDDSWRRQSTDVRVCGVRFTAAAAHEYHLATFPDVAALRVEPDFRLTHHGACGSCSTLQDLAVYATLDLTHMAAQCARRLTIGRQKACMQAIGFSEPCAESWAYNARHTRRHCARTCIAELGWRSALFSSGDALLQGEEGMLNACLECDELISGPGFQYSAGRTRRNSGIVSEIDRPDAAVRAVAHDYFD